MLARLAFLLAVQMAAILPAHGEQARLAASVGADHADLLAGVDLAGGTFDQQLSAAGEAEVAQGDQFGERRRTAPRVVEARYFMRPTPISRRLRCWQG